jgi:hypothetical protein
MKQLSALSLAIGVLGAIATWAFLTFGGVLIWAAFISWGCFFHCGGDDAALRNTIIGTVFGSLVATIAALIILGVPLADKLSLPVWAGIVVGATVWVICIAANIKAFSVIPANVYGYAATFAYLLQTPDRLNTAALTSLSMNNAFIAVAISLVIGALLGYVSGKLGAALMSKAAHA